MGSCVSVHKNPESVMKLRLSFASKTDKYVVPTSPIKDKQPLNVDRPMGGGAGLKSQLSPTRYPTTTTTTFADYGSKEETFFDSHPWLESDCDDDFLSVNGDFTPSRGSTPVHHSFTGTPRINKALSGAGTLDYKPEPSPTEKKKRLSDLFQERTRDDLDNDGHSAASGNQNLADGKKLEVKPSTIVLPPKSVNGTPFYSGATSVCSSERTPNRVLKAENNKALKSMQCCIPRLLSSCSFDEKKKKNMSPPGHSRG